MFQDKKTLDINKYITIVNTALSRITPIYAKQTLTELKGETDSSVITMETLTPHFQKSKYPDRR